MLPLIVFAILLAKQVSLLQIVYTWFIKVLKGWQEQQADEEFSDETPSTSSNQNRPRSFEDLFRPPTDLMFRGTFDMVNSFFFV